MTTRSNLRIAALIAGAVAVTAIATAAVTATISGGPTTLTQEEIDRQLAAGAATGTSTTTPATPATPGTATGTPTGTRTGGPTGTTTGTVAPGPGDVWNLTPATVTVRCDGNLATLVSWSPKSGWRSDDPVRGPAATVSVRFESDIYEDYKVTATCSNGKANVQIGPDDHHGGGDDD